MTTMNNAQAFACARKRPKAAILVVIMAGLIGACSKPAQKTEDVRPVRVVQVASNSVNILAEFPGEVRPRIESRLGFRVGGKIVARKVDTGSAVKRGQVLMQIDPQDLQLAQAQASAALKAAESNHILAKAELARYQDLREKNFVSQALLDAKESAFKAARAGYEQAQAAYKSQSNQAGYTTLIADADGVVTGIDAEVGQVVAAGTPVVRVAQLAEKEIVIGIPEDKVDALRRISDVKVRIWAKPEEIFSGNLREISPAADPVTRTFAARVAITDAADDIKIGMTAYVAFAAPSATPLIKLPMTALFQQKSSTAVWVVENEAVRLAPVTVSGPSGNEIIIANGLSPGQTVVTAGVNLLKPGQKVKILENDLASQPGPDIAGAGDPLASASPNRAAK